MNHKLIAVLMAVSTLMVSGCHKATEQKTSIDLKLNNFTDLLLANMVEKQQADSGLIMVVSTPTGHVKAASYMPCESKTRLKQSNIRDYSSLGGQIVTCLVALEAGTLCLSDSVDVGRGIYMVDSIMLRDHNFRIGGYGILTFHDAFVRRSNIATYMAASKAFGDNTELLREAYKRIGYKIDYTEEGLKQEKDFANVSIGNYYKIDSSDILEFVNAIANGGRMVELSFDEGKVNVYKPQIAKAENIKAVRGIFEDSNGFIRRKLQSKVSVGVMGGITQPADSVAGNCCKIELCGYFPTDNPQYTVYITLYKQGRVAQLGILAKAFEQLIEYFYTENQNN